MSVDNICGICLEELGNLNECALFTNAMKFTGKESDEYLTYLDCYELVTHLHLDVVALNLLYLCAACQVELENCFKFLRKAEKSQRLLNEKIEMAQSQSQDLSLNDIIEEIVSEENTAVPVLTDAMLGTNSTECFDELYKDDDLSCENDLRNGHLSPPNAHEDLVLPDIIITDDGVELESCDEEVTVHNEHKDEQFQCNLCPKKFQTQNSLKRHLKYHKRKDKDKIVACNICEKTFSTTLYLQQHMLMHNSAAEERRPQFKCEQCHKIYLTKSALRNHMRMHTGETLNCGECQKSFSTQYDLKIHMRFHTRDFPYACDLCDRKFAIKGHLRTHMWEHQGLKLQCEECQKLFTSTKALADHAFVHHADQMPYPCNYCDKSYPSKQKYKVHLLSAHEIEFDELEHGTAATAITKPKLRRKNLKLVQISEIESQTELSNEDECFCDNVILEVS